AFTYYRSSSDDAQNRNPSVTKTKASHSTISSKPFIKFVKAADRPTKDKTDKKETAKKPTVKYAELYRRTSKSSKVRGNQRNWNNLKSQQLGENFMKKNKACFNCGRFDHLSFDCRLGVKIGRACPKNNNTHKSMPPRAVVHKTRVKMLELELKARTSPIKVYKVDRGRFRPVMAWVPKKLLELILLKRPKKNTKCVSATGEELTAAKHKLKLLV
nr:ubiquitin hydrolase [Tanacetum cinerariifolium]